MTQGRLGTVMKCPWWRPHFWIFKGTQEITYPKAGPFDPRTDRERTSKEHIEICAQCGLERVKEVDYGW